MEKSIYSTCWWCGAKPTHYIRGKFDQSIGSELNTELDVVALCDECLENLVENGVDYEPVTREFYEEYETIRELMEE